MNDTEVSAFINWYESELSNPVTDLLTRAPGQLVQMLVAAHPNFKRSLPAAA